MGKLYFMTYLPQLRKKTEDLKNTVFDYFLKMQNIVYTIWVFTLRS